MAVLGYKYIYLPQSHPHLPTWLQHCAGTSRVVIHNREGMKRICCPKRSWAEARCCPAHPALERNLMDGAGEADIHTASLDPLGALGEGRWGGFNWKRKYSSTEVSWSPSGISASPASAEQLWCKCGSIGRSKCCSVNCCVLDLFFFVLLADPWGPLPALPSL